MSIDWKKRLEDEISTLQQTRDELRVQIHLGALEAQQVWDKAEQSWEDLDARVKVLGKATQQSAQEVEEATKLLVEEIKSGYKRVRDAL
jgi:predicted  nucleic acid-binding Zn-ribbon protein